MAWDLYSSGLFAVWCAIWFVWTDPRGVYAPVRLYLMALCVFQLLEAMVHTNAQGLHPELLFPLLFYLIGMATLSKVFSKNALTALLFVTVFTYLQKDKLDLCVAAPGHPICFFWNLETPLTRLIVPHCWRCYPLHRFAEQTEGWFRWTCVGSVTETLALWVLHYVAQGITEQNATIMMHTAWYSSTTLVTSYLWRPNEWPSIWAAFLCLAPIWFWLVQKSPVHFWERYVQGSVECLLGWLYCLCPVCFRHWF